MARPSTRTLVETHLRHLESLWVAPEIPARKVRNAMQSHGLPGDAEILALFDSTLFGGAADGVVVTEDRLSFKEIFDNPRAIRWLDFQPGDVHVDETLLRLAGLQVAPTSPWSATHANAFAAFLREVASGGTPTDWTPTEIVGIVRGVLGADDDAYFIPGIPPHKLEGVRTVHGIPDDEPILALYDDTVFGSARDGWAMTERRFAYKASFENPGQLAWGDLCTAEIEIDGPRLTFAGHSFTPLHARNVGPLAAVLEGLVDLARDALEPRHSELDDALRDDPDDEGVRQVYADWLIEQGHCRGLVGAVQLREGDDTELLDRYALELGLVFVTPGVARVQWHGGFWNGLWLFEAKLDEDVPTGAITRQALSSPSARFLRSLTLGAEDARLRPEHVSSIVDVLLQTELPCLERLVLFAADGSFVSNRLGKERWPRLQHLRLQVG